MASHQAGVVNFALNTSDLISEVNIFGFPMLTSYSMSDIPPNESFLLKFYVHCSVFLSDQGVTVDSKSCSYDAAEARCVQEFEDLHQTA